jgi:hypothetical protein
MGQVVPLRGAYPVARSRWRHSCLVRECGNSLVTGQILFVDGCVERSQHGERS